jgi:hypothetical protein
MVDVRAGLVSGVLVEDRSGVTDRCLAANETTFSPAWVPLSAGALSYLSARHRWPAFPASFMASTKSGGWIPETPH